MNRTPYRKGKKKRPPLQAIITHRPPNPGRTAGGIGWEYVYPAPPDERHEAPVPCDTPARYDASLPGQVRDGEEP